MASDILSYLSLVTAVIEGICFTGVIYGWSSLSFVLANAGYFYKDCPVNTSNEFFTNSSSDDYEIGTSHEVCNKQKENLVLVATMSLGTLSSSQMIAGIIFDKYGTLATRLCGTVSFTIGCIFVAFSAPNRSWMLYPGFTTMAFGGGVLIVPNMKIGNLFNNKRATVISLIEGCIDSSGIVLLIVKLAYQSGISIKSSFLFLAACTVLQWVRTLFLMPRLHIPYPMPREGFNLGLFRRTKPSELKEPKCLQTALEDSLVINEENDETRSFLQSVKNYRFWLNAMHISVLRLRLEMFICTLGDWLRATFPGSTENDISQYINVFGYMCLSVVFLAPLNGICVDKLNKYFKYISANEKIATSKATSIMLAVTSTLGVLFSIAVCIPNLHFQYVSFTFLFLLIACLFGGHSSFIALMFPENHFGRVNGLSKSISTIIAFLQYPLAISFPNFLLTSSFISSIC